MTILVTSQSARVMHLDSRLRGNDEYTESPVITAEAGIQRLGTVTGQPSFLRSCQFRGIQEPLKRIADAIGVTL